MRPTFSHAAAVHYHIRCPRMAASSFCRCDITHRICRNGVICYRYGRGCCYRCWRKWPFVSCQAKAIQSAAVPLGASDAFGWGVASWWQSCHGHGLPLPDLVEKESTLKLRLKSWVRVVVWYVLYMDHFVSLCKTCSFQGQYKCKMTENRQRLFRSVSYLNCRMKCFFTYVYTDLQIRYHFIKKIIEIIFQKECWRKPIQNNLKNLIFLTRNKRKNLNHYYIYISSSKYVCTIILSHLYRVLLTQNHL